MRARQLLRLFPVFPAVALLFCTNLQAYDGGNPVVMEPDPIIVPVGGTAIATAEVTYSPNQTTWKIHSVNQAIAAAEATLNPDSQEITFQITGKSVGEVDIVADFANFGYGPRQIKIGSVTVIPCIAPTFLEAPAATMVSSGQRATLEVSMAGTPPFQFRWFSQEGDSTPQFLGGGRAFITTGPLLRTTRVWVEVTGVCGTLASNPVTVTVQQPRTRSVRH